MIGTALAFLRDRPALQLQRPGAAPAALTCSWPSASPERNSTASPFGSFAHYLAADEEPHGLETSIKKKARPSQLPWYSRARWLLRRRPLLCSPRAETQILAQVNLLSYFCHVLAADQPGTNPRQFAFAAHSGCSANSVSATTRPRTASPRYSRRSLSAGADFLAGLPACASWWASERCVSARTSSSGLEKLVPQCCFKAH